MILLSLASGPITSWQIDGKQWKQWIFLGSKITAHGDCSHEIKRCLLLGRKAMTNLHSRDIKKQRHYFANKSPSSQSYAFPVVMYGCESWTVKKAGSWRIDAFELWCWKRLLRIPWTAKRSNQSILKEITPEYSLEGLMLKLKLQHWPPGVKNGLIWRDRYAGKDWRWEERETTEDEMVGWHHWLRRVYTC